MTFNGNDPSLNFAVGWVIGIGTGMFWAWKWKLFGGRKKG